MTRQHQQLSHTQFQHIHMGINDFSLYLKYVFRFGLTHWQSHGYSHTPRQLPASVSAGPRGWSS